MTLAAIQRAIANHPDYFAPEVQTKAAQLLSQIRTDRAIKAADIKSVISVLDRMSTPGQQLQSGQDIIAARLAAEGVPNFARDCEPAYVKLAAKTICQTIPPGGFATLNITAALSSFNQRMSGIYGMLGGDPDGIALLSAAVTNRELNAPNRSLTTDATKINTLISRIQANVAELHTIEAQYGAAAKEAVLNFLKSYGKPIPTTASDPAPLTRLAEARRNLVVPMDFHALGANTPVDQLHRTVMALCESVATVKAGIVVGVEEEHEIPKYFANCALEGMTAAQKQGLLDALESDGGRHLQSLYELKMASNEKAHLADTILHEMVPRIRADLGLPDVNKPIELPVQVDAAKLSPAIFATFNE